MPRKKASQGKPATALPGPAQPGLCGQPPPPGRRGVGSCPGPPSLLVAVCGDSPLVPRNAVIFGPDVIKVVPRFPANQQLRNTAPSFPPLPLPLAVKACEHQGWGAQKASGSPTVLCPCKAGCPHRGGGFSSSCSLLWAAPPLQDPRTPNPPWAGGRGEAAGGLSLASLRRSWVRGWPAGLTAPVGGSLQGPRRPRPGERGRAPAGEREPAGALL